MLRPSGDRGAQPFDAEELTKLREHTGDDLLAFLVLRWTGLRGGDAVALTWQEIKFDRKEIERVTQKRGEKLFCQFTWNFCLLWKMNTSE